MATVSLLGAHTAHAQGVEITRFKSNGSFASGNSLDPATGTGFDYAVHVNSVGSDTTTFFAFNLQHCAPDFSICTGTFGSGNIPNGDFSLSSGIAKLNTNLSTNSGFTMFSYVQDNINFTFTSTPIPTAGIATVTWKKIPRQSQSQSGTSSFISGGFTSKFTGSSSSDSATATGTLIGNTIPAGGSNFIGQSSQSSVVISHN